jgi:hypothetical protein
MSDHKRFLSQATDALQDIITCGHEVSIAATTDDRVYQDELRAQAHEHLDVYLDHMSSAGTAAGTRNKP